MTEHVGPYEIVGQIGRGGMAVVHLARQPALGRRVALKELAPFYAHDEMLARRFIREARMAGSLSHPNVVTVYDFVEHDGTAYIAMEYLERGSLRPSVGGLSPAQVAGVLEGLLAALAHAESMGIVHRDIKPENLLITPGGAIKIADFGIAKAYQDVATEEMLTPAGATVGTPTYMAPEQVMAQAVGPWTDLYQTGVVAYELLAGRVPFHTEGAPLAVMMQHVSDPVPPLPPGTDPALERWVRRLLAKDASERPGGARAAWDELEEIIVGMLGPLWRRDARLGEPDPTEEQSLPLTPARFSSWQDYIPASPALAPPPPATPPPSATPTPPAGGTPPLPGEAPWGAAADSPPPAAPEVAATLPPRLPAAAVPPARPPRRASLGFLRGLVLVLVLVLVAVAALLLTRGGGDGDQKATATRSPAPTATGTATATVAPGPFDVGDGPDGIAVGAGAVWVAASGEGVLVRLDTRTGATRRVKVGANPDSVIVAFGEVWVSLTGEDRVARVSAGERPRLLGEVAVGSRPEGLAASAHAVWVANAGDGTVTQILASTHAARSVPGVGGRPVDVAVGAGAVWVPDSARAALARIDGGRRVLAATIRGIGPNPRSVAIVGRDVWVVTAGDGRAWQIDGDANTVTGSVHVGGQPRDVTTDGEHLWVTDRKGDRVVEIDPATRTVVAHHSVAGGPLEVAVDERDVWVSSFDNGTVTRLSR